MRTFKQAKNRKPIASWLAGVAAGALIAGLPVAVAADYGESAEGIAAAAGTSSAPAVATSTDASIEETNRYYLRLMTHIFDGSKDFSHTQVAGFARMRKDDQSWTMLDFGDGAVVISDATGLAASGFENLSGAELGVLYDYSSKRIAGTSQLANFHNEIVLPHLSKAPALGSNVDWSTSLPAGSLGLPALSGQAVKLELSRRYFNHDGKPMVLIEYRIPVVSLDTLLGNKVLHWGRGFALSDPGFGTIYANVALHRSARTEADGSMRPYRFYRAAFASDDSGAPMLDIATVPQVAAIYDQFFGKAAQEVIPYSDQGTDADQSPIRLAANLDIIAMSIGENGANDNGALAGAQTGGNRGAERPKPLPQIPVFGGSQAQGAADAIGARAVTGPRAPNPAPTEPASAPAANEALNTQLGTESAPRPTTRRIPEPPDGPIFDENGKQIVTRGGSGGSGGGEGGQGTGGGGGGSGSRSLGDSVEDALASKTASDIGANVNLGVTVVDKTSSITPELLRFGNSLNSKIVAYEKRLLAISNDIKQTAREFNIAVKEREALLNTTLETNRILEKTNEANQLAAKWNSLQKELQIAIGDSTLIGRQLREFVNVAGDAPLPKLQELLGGPLGKNLGKILTPVNATLNVNNVVVAGQNAYGAATSDQSVGKLTLNRKYYDPSGKWLDNFEAMRDLGLDILGLAIDTGSGNLVGAATGGASLLTQSLSDMYIALKGLKDVNELNTRLTREEGVMQRRLREKQEKARAADLSEIDEGLKEVEAELAALKASGSSAPQSAIDDNWNPNYDRATGLPKPDYWRWLKKNRPGELIAIGINPDAPVGHTGPWPPAGQRGEVTAQRPAPAPAVKPEVIRATINQDYDYPTAPAGANDKRPVKVAKPAEAPPAFDFGTQEETERAARQAQAKADLEAYQTRRFAERKAEEAARAARPRGIPFQISELRTSDLTTSNFNIKPVVFSGVSFDDDGDLFVRNPDGTTSLRKVGPDDLKLPDFVLPDFRAPSPSGIAWTKFAGTQYPGSGGIPSWSYEAMSGKLITDLEPFREFLAGHDIRELERLARLAGFPNLATALQPANLRFLANLANDKGARAWSRSTPIASASVGAHIGAQQRTLARNQIALFDILSTSREATSTGGLSDVAISGDQLRYMLRDFGLEDGDIVNVLIQQFGRDIFKGQVNLTNAGEDFDILLRRGVAVLTLTAVNEGAISPNTAEINLQQVTRGNARQTYSLTTGETATLRIETNRPGGQ